MVLLFRWGYRTCRRRRRRRRCRRCRLVWDRGIMGWRYCGMEDIVGWRYCWDRGIVGWRYCWDRGIVGIEVLGDGWMNEGIQMI